MKPNNLAETMCAFSNRNDGTILIGVDDSGRVVGVTDPKKVEEFVVNVSRNNCDRPIFPSIESVSIDTAEIVVVSVSMDGKAHAVDGRFYVRVGSTDQPATVEEVETLIQSMMPGISDRESLEDRSGTALFAYLTTVIGGGLFLIFWTYNPASAFIFAVLGTAFAGAAILCLKHLIRLTNTDMAALIRGKQPLVLFVFILFTMGIITLNLFLALYPLYSKVIFSTQLSALSVFSPLVTSLVALVEGIMGVPGMPRFDLVHIRGGVGGYARRFKSYGKTGVAIGLIVLAVSILVVPVDIGLVLWTPKVGLVEYRYVIGDTIYFVPLGQSPPRFEAYTINEELVHILRPAYPLVSSFTYSLVSNSTRDPTIVKEVGTSCQLVTESGLLTGLKISFTDPPAVDPVCDVRYYNGLDVSSAMSFEESTPDLPITHFENGTTQWQHTITIRNLSLQYSLELLMADPLFPVRGWYNVTIVNNDTNVMLTPSPTESGTMLYLAQSSSLMPNGLAKIMIVYNGP